MAIKICCIKLSLAARIIAMIGLIAAVLVLTQLSTELAEPAENGGGTVSILLGLDVDDYVNSGATWQNGTLTSGSFDIQGLEVLIAFLIFSFIYAVASAILIWGSIVEVSCFAFPWLFCELVSFITQIVTVTIHCMSINSKKDKWIIFLSIFNLLISVYFWIVVFAASLSWSRQKKEEKERRREAVHASSSTLSSRNESVDQTLSNPPAVPKCVQV